METRSRNETNGSLPIVRLHGVDCRILMQRYELGNRIRLQLIAVDDELPYACATVNVPGVELAANEVLIKDWSENQGVLAALVAAGVVEETGRTVPTGRVEAKVTKLLI